MVSVPGWGAGRKYRGILLHRSYELWFVDVSLLISINPSRRCWSRPYVRKLWSPLHQQWNLNRFIVYGGFHVVCIFFTNSTRFICCWWIQRKSCTVPKIYIYIWNPCTSWGVRIYQLYYRRGRSIRPLYTTARLLVCEACNGMLYFPLLGWEGTLLTMDFRDPWGSNGWLLPWVYPRFRPIQESNPKRNCLHSAQESSFWFRDFHPGIDPENEHGWRENHLCLFWYQVCILSSSNGWLLPIAVWIFRETWWNSSWILVILSLGCGDLQSSTGSLPTVCPMADLIDLAQCCTGGGSR